MNQSRSQKAKLHVNIWQIMQLLRIPEFHFYVYKIELLDLILITRMQSTY